MKSKQKIHFKAGFRLTALAACLMAASVAQAQTLTTLVGTGIPGTTNNGGQANQAQTQAINSVAYDSKGNYYIAEFRGNVVRKVARNGVITILAGTGVAGFSPDGTAAAQAMLNGPGSVVINPLNDDVVIFENGNNRIRYVSADGILRTAAGNGTASSTGDGGHITASTVNNAYAGAYTRDGSKFYFTEQGGNKVRGWDTTGANAYKMFTLAGTGVAGFAGDGALATAAQLNGPRGIAVDMNGWVYVADSSNYRIRRIRNGNMETFAGNGQPGTGGDGGPATSAQLGAASFINVFNGQAQTWGGLENMVHTSYGSVLLVDRANNRVREVDVAGTITTLIGSTQGFTADGPVTLATARLNQPTGIAIKRDGSIVLSEAGNRRLRQISFPANSFDPTWVDIKLMPETLPLLPSWGCTISNLRSMNHPTNPIFEVTVNARPWVCPVDKLKPGSKIVVTDPATNITAAIRVNSFVKTGDNFVIQGRMTDQADIIKSASFNFNAIGIPGEIKKAFDKMANSPSGRVTIATQSDKNTFTSTMMAEAPTRTGKKWMGVDMVDVPGMRPQMLLLGMLPNTDYQVAENGKIVPTTAEPVVVGQIAASGDIAARSATPDNSADAQETFLLAALPFTPPAIVEKVGDTTITMLPVDANGKTTIKVAGFIIGKTPEAKSDGWLSQDRLDEMKATMPGGKPSSKASLQATIKLDEVVLSRNLDVSGLSMGIDSAMPALPNCAQNGVFWRCGTASLVTDFSFKTSASVVGSYDVGVAFGMEVPWNLLPVGLPIWGTAGGGIDIGSAGSIKFGATYGKSFTGGAMTVNVATGELSGTEATVADNGVNSFLLGAQTDANINVGVRAFGSVALGKMSFGPGSNAVETVLKNFPLMKNGIFAITPSVMGGTQLDWKSYTDNAKPILATQTCLGANVAFDFMKGMPFVAVAFKPAAPNLCKAFAMMTHTIDFKPAGAMLGWDAKVLTNQGTVPAYAPVIRGF